MNVWGVNVVSSDVATIDSLNDTSKVPAVLYTAAVTLPVGEPVFLILTVHDFKDLPISDELA